MKPITSSLLGHGLPQCLPGTDATSRMPAVLTLDALIRLPDGAGGVINRARVSAREFHAWVEWRSRTIDPRLRRGRQVMAPKDLSVPPGRCIAVHGLLPLGERLPLL